MTSTRSRIRGSLYGTAVVDALGGPVEFRRRGTFVPVTSYRFNANFGLKPGTWTDDTSMMLCLAQSLVDKGGNFVIHDQITKYVDWYQNGYMSATGKCFDIGNATRQSLEIWAEFTSKPEHISALELQHYQDIVDKALMHEVRYSERSLLHQLIYLRREHAVTAPLCAVLPYHSSTTGLQRSRRSMPPRLLHPRTRIQDAKKRARFTLT